MSEERSETRALRVIGFASVGLYVILAVFFWTVWSFEGKVLEQVVLVLVTGALALLYFLGLKFARHAAASTIVIVAVAMSIIAFLMPPFDSTDVFFYVAKGWQQTHYDSNPYSRSLRSLQGAADDPMIQSPWMSRNRNAWLDIPLPYGFLFALLLRAVAWLGHGHFWLTLRIFGFLNLLMHAGTAFLLWKATRLLPGDNGRTVLYLYAWNPFVVLQYLANLHNDIIVAFLVVAAAYLLLKQRSLWSLPLLVAATLIKYITLPLVPFAFIFLVRQKGWWQAIYSFLLSILLVVITAVPYIGEIASFRFSLIFEQLFESRGSLHAFAVYSLRAIGRIWATSEATVWRFGIAMELGLWFAFGTFVAIHFYRLWKSECDEPQAVIQQWTSILFALIVVVSTQFYAWYIGMMFPLALLTRRKTVFADLVVALSAGHLLSFTFLSSKAIGYFLLATLLPMLYLVSTKNTARRRFIPITVA